MKVVRGCGAPKPQSEMAPSCAGERAEDEAAAVEGKL